MMNPTPLFPKLEGLRPSGFRWGPRPMAQTVKPVQLNPRTLEAFGAYIYPKPKKGGADSTRKRDFPLV